MITNDRTDVIEHTHTVEFYLDNMVLIFRDACIVIMKMSRWHSKYKTETILFAHLSAENVDKLIRIKNAKVMLSRHTKNKKNMRKALGLIE